tara:strand:- start:52 stop:390 length:339 start_codon:yes stop_codon:yes gene_type:complete
MPRFHRRGGEDIPFTAEEESQRDAEEKVWADGSADRKLVKLKKMRLIRLQETDYLANSDVTMPDNIKTWRQSLRDIPQTYTTEVEYDILLAREEDKSSVDYEKLIHAIWTKP